LTDKQYIELLMNRNQFLIVVSVLLLIGLAGCSSAPQPEQTAEPTTVDTQTLKHTQ
jgi:uncharacterized lipoprotein